METQGQLLDWLHKTQALEEGAVAVMRDHAPRLGNHPCLSALLADNVEESLEQAIRLRACIDALGGRALRPNGHATRNDSALADAAAALARVLVEEEATRGVLALYALKHLEIGSYRFLVKAAGRCDEPDIAAICRHNLQQELAMADRMELQLEAMSE